MAEPKKTNTKAQTKSEIEVPIGYTRIMGYERIDGQTPTGAKPVNNVQTDEFYSLPAVSNVPAEPKEEADQPIPEVSATDSDLNEYKTGKPVNTTAGQLDLAIERFHGLQAEAVAEPDTVAAKLDLLNRLDVLALEADQSVKDKIAMIRAAL